MSRSSTNWFQTIFEKRSEAVNVNTWGDALFFVFNNVEDAGCPALTFGDLVVKTD